MPPPPILCHHCGIEQLIVAVCAPPCAHGLCKADGDTTRVEDLIAVKVVLVEMAISNNLLYSLHSV